MTILFDATRRVKTTNRLFGLGLGVYRQPRPYNGPTEEDWAWYNADLQARMDREAERRAQARRFSAELDHMAEERAWQDAYESGIAF